MPLEGLQLGRYRLLRLLGSGGMGEVYLAEDARINRQVAIKVIREEASAYPDADTTKEAARLFQREVKAISGLDHPNILPLFDYGEERVNGATLTYMVMPYRQESSLANWLEKRGSSTLLSPQDVVHFIRQAAAALQYAHDRQIIHQDVKPSNFLIRTNTENPNRPDLLLADFGIAKFSTATSTMSHSIRGTPTYMAPEQWSAEPVTATDQYALAVMAYELLAGRPPFQGPPMRMMYLHSHTQPQPPSTFNPRLSSAIDAVLLKALAKQPADRFPSISAFANALQQALSGEDLPTIPNTLRKTKGADIRATLAISKVEALNGTSRNLTLPGARQVMVTVPAGAQDGQIIRLEGLGEPSSDGGPAGSLILTLAVQPTAEAVLAFNTASADKTVSVSDPKMIPGPLTPGIHETQASIKRRGFVRSKTMLLVGLVMLIVLASIGSFSIIGLNQISTNNANAIATAQAKDATAFAANATATTRANATTTAIAQINATATIIAENPDPYPPNTGKLALFDPLRDNSEGYSWVQNNDTNGSCTFTGGAYQVSSPISPLYHGCAALNTNFSNLAYEVSLKIVAGDCGAIIFRANLAIYHYYYFRICQNGTYQLLLYTNNGLPTKTFASGFSPVINSGLDQSNVIAVVANNNFIAVYVNHQFVSGVTDGSYSEGQIGVVADNDHNPTVVLFSNVKVWTF